jgi:hypothetical protein
VEFNGKHEKWQWQEPDTTLARVKRMALGGALMDCLLSIPPIIPRYKHWISDSCPVISTYRGIYLIKTSEREKSGKNFGHFALY